MIIDESVPNPQIQSLNDRLKIGSSVKSNLGMLGALYLQAINVAESLRQKHPLSEKDHVRLRRQHNIGVSAHIDSGKTTLTERILYYTGRIRDIHKARRRATRLNATNIVDTPGHVDFTIEVKRALRVLDGATLVLCAVTGVQSQTTTVDRQMRRYNVTRISFINKMDCPGANPWRAIQQIRSKLRISAAAVQAWWTSCAGRRSTTRVGIDVVESDEIPVDALALAQEKRTELIGTLADVDDGMAELFLEEKPPTAEQLVAAIRCATVGLRFSPAFLGSAIKNTAAQSLLNGVCAYLTNPAETRVVAHDRLLRPGCISTSNTLRLWCSPTYESGRLSFSAQALPYEKEHVHRLRLHARVAPPVLLALCAPVPRTGPRCRRGHTAAAVRPADAAALARVRAAAAASSDASLLLSFAEYLSYSAQPGVVSPSSILRRADGDGEDASSTPGTTLEGADASQGHVANASSHSRQLIDCLRAASLASSSGGGAASPVQQQPHDAPQKGPVESTESPFRIVQPQPRTSSSTCSTPARHLIPRRARRARFAPVHAVPRVVAPVLRAQLALALARARCRRRRRGEGACSGTSEVAAAMPSSSASSAAEASSHNEEGQAWKAAESPVSLRSMGISS
ncbi:P-loop containing nucleoside triphosphate hydrolase protein [Phellopilus nigrolimitatus]|nr:P-loop containing nucleoside triphosphate hydrolase protein [Phellopilus nigrolimitatus]